MQKLIWESKPGNTQTKLSTPKQREHPKQSLAVPPFDLQPPALLVTCMDCGRAVLGGAKPMPGSLWLQKEPSPPPAVGRSWGPGRCSHQSQLEGDPYPPLLNCDVWGAKESATSPKTRTPALILQKPRNSETPHTVAMAEAAQRL